jgi:hypothetical protein
MKPDAKRVFTLLVLPAIALVLGGCLGVAVSGYGGPTPVYGDYGYVGPWDSGRVEVVGGYFAAPPYRRSDRDHRDQNSRHRGEATPERAAPAQRAALRPIPSIPNNPRPARQRGGNDRNQR